jgi:hypothetical protein
MTPDFIDQMKKDAEKVGIKIHRSSRVNISEEEQSSLPKRIFHLDKYTGLNFIE